VQRSGKELIVGVVDWFRRFFERSVVPREPVTLRPVAVVRNGVREPRMGGWQDVRSDIIVRQDLEPTLDGIDSYSHLIVVFYMQGVPEHEKERTHVHPRGDPRYPLQGVLATRSPLRPNPIGVAVVPLVRRKKNILRVRGLDALDGTPVLDVKPYLPQYDSVPDARLPEWATQPPEERQDA
jgi:tRNA-Thr(GGU) m(6)t(6)A37 methyltransferase TsaA